MNAVIDPKEFDAAQAAAAKAAAAADPYTYTHKLQKPLDYEGKHYESLTFDWGKLTGNDSLAIEAELTALKQPVIIPSMSAGYLIRMACRACTEPIGVDVIGAMSIRDYNTIRTKARNFFAEVGLVTGDGGVWLRRQVLAMAQVNCTPAPYWLEMPCISSGNGSAAAMISLPSARERERTVSSGS